MHIRHDVHEIWVKTHCVGLLLEADVVGDGVTVFEGAALEGEGDKSVEDELAIVDVDDDSGVGTLRDTGVNYMYRIIVHHVRGGD